MDQFLIPARLEQIHAVEMAQGFGHVAFLQPHRDDENFIVRKEVRFFECKFEFLVAVSVLFIEAARETDEDHFTFEDGIADLILPILTGFESFRVEPGMDAIPGHALIEFVDSFPVAVRVDEEDACFSC